MYHGCQLWSVIKGSVDSRFIVVGTLQNADTFCVSVHPCEQLRFFLVGLGLALGHTGEQLASPTLKCRGEAALATLPTAAAFSYEFCHKWKDNLLATILYKVSVSLF